MCLQRDLGDALQFQGACSPFEREFTPHVTLFYGKRQVATHAVEPVGWLTRAFVLIHNSRLGLTQHIPLGRWPLR